jgi:hypothetical protein
VLATDSFNCVGIIRSQGETQAVFELAGGGSISTG